jgi:hypothetical protein
MFSTVQPKAIQQGISWVRQICSTNLHSVCLNKSTSTHKFSKNPSTNLHPFQWNAIRSDQELPGTQNSVCIIYWRSNKQNYKDAVNICSFLHTPDVDWTGYINGSAVYWQLINCRLQSAPDNCLEIIRSNDEHAVDDKQRWISGTSGYFNMG